MTEPLSTTYVEGYYLPEAFDPDTKMEAGRSYLERLAEAHRAGGLTVHVHTAFGQVATRIADIARETGIDLIAMATHGRGGLARFVLGSVATATLQQAGVPLLLVRPSGASQITEGEAARAAVPLLLDAADLTVLERGLAHLLEMAGPDQAQAGADAATARNLLQRVEKAKSGLTSTAAGKAG